MVRHKAKYLLAGDILQLQGTRVLVARVDSVDGTDTIRLTLIGDRFDATLVTHKDDQYLLAMEVK